MNLLLLPEDAPSRERHCVRGERAQHIRRVLKLEVGAVLKVAVERLGRGHARVASLGESEVWLDELCIDEEQAAPAVSVVLALPRPKALKRCVQTAASFGIRELHLINAWRVDKSYWSSPLVARERIEEELRLGCEQGCQSWLPTLQLHRYFKGFVESLGTEPEQPRFLAHPGSERWLHRAAEAAKESGGLIAIGPEGGWIEAELESFDRAGFERVSVSTAVLRSEIALAASLALWQAAGNP